MTQEKIAEGLPSNPHKPKHFEYQSKHWFRADEDRQIYHQAQQDMLKAGYHKLPEGKPPLLEEHNCHQVDNPFDYNMGAQAQWDIWNEWYEAIKG